MIDALVTMLAVGAAYLIGSIPSGYIIARLVKGVDIRQHGSANVGATNVYRVTGKVPGVMTLVCDILKGFVVVTALATFTYQFTVNIDENFFRALLGLTVVSGHIWSVFLGFSGGKGVATTIGVMAGIAPGPLVVALIVWVVAFAATNFVSFGSLIFGVALPVATAIFRAPFYSVMLAVALCILNTYKHSTNIKRLLKGDENKIYIFKNMGIVSK